jgi:hypothetical protein
MVNEAIRVKDEDKRIIGECLNIDLIEKASQQDAFSWCLVKLNLTVCTRDCKNNLNYKK